MAGQLSASSEITRGPPAPLPARDDEVPSPSNIPIGISDLCGQHGVENSSHSIPVFFGFGTRGSSGPLFEPSISDPRFESESIFVCKQPFAERPGHS